MTRHKTSDLIQGKVLAVLPWDGGLKTELVARRAGLTENTARRALEDLLHRRMVECDDQSYWRKVVLPCSARDSSSCGA